MEAMLKLKVMTVLGTRPEIIRLSRVMAMLDRYVDHVIVHTGQNWDYDLNEVFFTDLQVRKPDYFLGVDVSSLGAVLGGILIETEKVISAEKPDAVLILGDTNSAIAAIIARRMKVPVYHMEAGNRSFDRNVPEETNRRLVDHVSDFNLVYTEHARRHLLSEGIHHRRIYVTGSPMNEVLNHYRSAIEKSDVLQRLNLTENSYFVASLHREENVDIPARLQQLIDSLNSIAEIYDCPVIVSTHPRTRKRLDQLEEISLDDRVQYMKPFGFHDYNFLQMNAKCVISDSGTIAEESSMLGFPGVTPRDAIERPEAIDTGAVIFTGLNRENLVSGVQLAIDMFSESQTRGARVNIPQDYTVENTAERVVKLICGSARLSNSWDGIR